MSRQPDQNQPPPGAWATPSAPAGGYPPTAAYSVPTATVGPPPGPSAARSNGLVGLGIAALVAGVLIGIVLIVMAGSAYDDAVKDLARGPANCATTLDFDKAGTYTLYLETKGSIGEVDGSCPISDTDYEHTGGLPDVDIVVTSPDGAEVDLGDSKTVTYSAAGARGTAVNTVTIDDPGDYELTVTSPDSDFVVAVGKNPKSAADSMKLGGYAAIAAGVIVGLGLIVLGKRRQGTPGGGAARPAPHGQQPPSPQGYYPPTQQQPAQPGYYPPTPQPPAQQPGGYYPPTQPQPSYQDPTQPQPSYQDPTQPQPSYQDPTQQYPVQDPPQQPGGSWPAPPAR